LVEWVKHFQGHISRVDVLLGDESYLFELVDYLKEKIGKFLLFVVLLLLVFNLALLFFDQGAIVVLVVIAMEGSIQGYPVTVSSQLLMLSIEAIVSHSILDLTNESQKFDLEVFKLDMAPQLLLFQSHLRDVLLVFFDRLDLDLSEKIARAHQFCFVDRIDRAAIIEWGLTGSHLFKVVVNQGRTSHAARLWSATQRCRTTSYISPTHPIAATVRLSRIWHTHDICKLISICA